MVPMDHLFFATELASWDERIAHNPDGCNVFQSSEMATTKQLGGWTPRYLVADDIALTILQKRVPLLGKYWYIPKGPGVTTCDELLALLPSLSDFARQHGVFCIKIESEIIESPEARQTLASAGLIQTAAVQPNSSTVVIDLSPSLDDIMAGLNQKGRHAIHRAERDGVVARAVEPSDANLRTMYELLADTAAGRFESSLRSYDYYRAFWQSFTASGRGSLFFAYVDDHIVAAAYCMYLGTKGLYKDGASVRERTVYGASHLLQWEVIKWMKERGVTSYDLCGSPHSSAIRDETHPFYGIGRFKTSFNKQVTDYIGCYDLIIRPVQYRIWQQLGQRLVLSLSYRFKHRQWF